MEVEEKLVIQQQVLTLVAFLFVSVIIFVVKSEDSSLIENGLSNKNE